MTDTRLDLDALTARVRQTLLAERNSLGHWTGELSSSPLSTATAVCALALSQRLDPSRDHAIMVEGGLRWLLEHQNADGGWGDTIYSLSNISTTTLCRAVFELAADATAHRAGIAAADGWLLKTVGDTSREHLCEAIYARYGKDRTFAVPILTMCALCGYLGKDEDAWKRIVALPFEAAAIPHAWYSLVNMQVVSYALPALIAIGLVHFRRRRPNPFSQLLRAAAEKRVLRKLAAIQPASGGFLEATPLTSFVAMSLIGAGEGASPVVNNCLAFLIRERRADGSWPIDTNLATWVTTLSINALAISPDFDRDPPREERAPLRSWLLGQQYQTVHPYTDSPAGGWAWTDLSGGVPDGDDTPGALIALHRLGVTAESANAAKHGITWLLQLQNRDGGMPTFCRGWGRLPFDQSCSDLTIHALRAFRLWLPHLPADLAVRAKSAIMSGTVYLRNTQRHDGSWLPRWFGNQHAPGGENPVYGTAKIVAGLAELNCENKAMLTAGCQWLLAVQNQDGGWGGAAGVASSLEETALAVDALAAATCAGAAIDLSPALHRGIVWIAAAWPAQGLPQPTPIGFYFANLWYFERLYPVIFTLGALNRARLCLAACRT